MTYLEMSRELLRMRTPAILAVGMILCACSALLENQGAASGENGASPAPPPTAWINPSEVILEEGRLYFSTMAMGLEMGEKATVSLRGKGAPMETVEFGMTPASKNPHGSARCSGIGLDNRDPDGYDLWKECSFSGGSLEAGVYTIEVGYRGAVIGQHTFELIEMPSAGGEKEIAVDPASRVRRPYLHGQGFVIWLPIDARTYARTVTVSAYDREGKIVETAQSIMHGPYAGESDSLLHVTPFVTRFLPTKGGEFRYVVFLDDVYVGTWARWAAKKKDSAGHHDKGSHCIEYGGFGFAYQERECSYPLGPILEGEATQEMIAEVRGKAIENLERIGESCDEYGIGNECHIFISYPEELVCAYASSAEVKKTFHSLRQVQGETNRLGISFSMASETAASKYSTKKEKKEAKETMKSSATGVAGGTAIEHKLQNKLKEAAKKYKKGCLAGIVPGPVASVLIPLQ
jgi:hypothetical protein